MIQVLLNPFYQSIFYMNYLIGLVGYPTFMGYYHNGQSLLTVQIFQNIHHLYRSLTVQCSGRLISKNYPGFRNQCTCYGHTLLLSARQLIRHMVCPLLQSQFIQIFQSQLISFFPAYPLIKQRQRHILHGVLKRYEVERLKDKPNHSAAQFCSTRFTQAFYQNPVQKILSRIIIIQYPQNIQQRRFTRTRCPHNRNKFTLRNI